MCEPATITAGMAWMAANAGTIAAVSSVAGAGLSIASMNSQADAQNTASDAQAKAIGKSQIDNYAQVNRQGVEDAQNATVEGDKIRREMAARVASAKVGAAGAGVAGLSVDALLLDLSGKGLEASTTSATNYARSVASRADVAANLENSSNSQRAQLKYANGAGALDYLGAGLKVANAGVTYSKSQPK